MRLMPNLRWSDSSRKTQLIIEPKLRSWLRWRNESATMKPRVEPDAFHHDVRRDEVADEIFFAFGVSDVELVFGHALHVFVDVMLPWLSSKGRVEVKVKDFLAVEREGFQHVFERDAVVGFFPHLLGEIEVAFRRFEIRIDAERDRAVDDELGRD